MFVFLRFKFNQNENIFKRSNAKKLIYLFKAQITSPNLEFSHKISGFLENVQDLIRALTGLSHIEYRILSCIFLTRVFLLNIVLCRDSSDIEIFLIGAAALANLTFSDCLVYEYFSQFGTLQVLIENYYLKNYTSIFVKDQVTKKYILYLS